MTKPLPFAHWYPIEKFDALLTQWRKVNSHYAKERIGDAIEAFRTYRAHFPNARIFWLDTDSRHKDYDPTHTAKTIGSWRLCFRGDMWLQFHFFEEPQECPA